jgi:DNA-binding MarR family transcriptional regulator
MLKRRHSAAQTIAPSELMPEGMSDRSAAEELVSRRILVLANVLKRAAGLRYRRILDLPAGEWGVIAELGIQAPQSLNALSNNIGLDKTQLSKSVSRLVDRGLVQRRVKPDNNREVLISLTASGRTCFRKILDAGQTANEVLLAGLSTQERRIFSSQIVQLTEIARTLLKIEQDLGTTVGEMPD